MGSDELNGSRTNPFMSKELFNYVWLINPNPSIPLTIYLFNQVPCNRSGAVCGWRCWASEIERNKRGSHTIRLEEEHWSQNDSFSRSICNIQNACSTSVSVNQLLLTLKKGHRTLPRGDFKHKACSELTSSTAILLFHHVQKREKKEHLKALSLEWKKRLSGRLTQLPFIASDKRLNHTLHCLKCLLVIRSRILLSSRPLAVCSWSKPNDGVSAIGCAGRVNLPIGDGNLSGQRALLNSTGREYNGAWRKVD